MTQFVPEVCVARLSVAERRALLVDAAFRVIARGGVEAATTRAICAEAQMAQASFHYAFASRDELLAAVVARGHEAEFNAATAPLAWEGVAGSASDVLRAGMRSLLERLVKDPGQEQAMIALNQYAQRTPGLEPLAERIYRRYYAMAEAFLTAVAEASQVRWAEPVEYLAPLVIAGTDGMTMAYLATRDRVVAERIITTVVDTICTYLRES